MSGCLAVYYREILILKRKFFKQIASMAVNPLLYLIAFGFAMGRNASYEGRTYQEFLIPGLVAMVSMTQSFAIASEINIARFYWRIFEEFQSAPLSNLSFVAGEVLAGVTRAVIAVLVILIIALVFGVALSYGLMFWLAVLLNAVLFSGVAVCMAMLVQSHGDQVLLTNFVITPMAFLGGTFFPLGHMPIWVQKALSALPLTHAAAAIRASSFGAAPEPYSYVVLLILGALSFLGAFLCVDKARD